MSIMECWEYSADNFIVKQNDNLTNNYTLNDSNISEMHKMHMMT